MKSKIRNGNEGSGHDLFRAGMVPSPQEATGFNIWRMALFYRRRAEALLKPIGLTHLQFQILCLTAWKHKSGLQTNQRNLAEMSGVQESQISLMVRALKRKKLLSQGTSDTDSRLRLIDITQSGIDILVEAVPEIFALQLELWPKGAQTDRFHQLIADIFQRWEKFPQ